MSDAEATASRDQAEQDRREAWLEGLHAIYEFYKDNPHIIPHHGFDIVDYSAGDEKRRAIDYIKALGSADKLYTDTLLRVKSEAGRFGAHEVRYAALRTSVCTKHVETVTKEVQVPDPDAPLVTRTVTEEIVTWDCEPLLEGA